MAAFYKERAKGEVGLIVTGGIAPNSAGRVVFGAAKMTSSNEAKHHKIVTDAVHEAGGRIAMQILHSGRYAYHLSSVSASALKSPISFSTPKALTSDGIKRTIDDFSRCAFLAKSAGYVQLSISYIKNIHYIIYLIFPGWSRNYGFGRLLDKSVFSFKD
jgi:2,4-dienoyl-CoA reductase (NADPH2)